MNFYFNLLKPIFLFLIFTIIIFFHEQNYLIKRIHKSRIQLLANTEKIKERKFYENYEFILNNNVLQYSSYILIDKANLIVIVESIIHVNFHRIQHFSGINIFSCLLKSIKSNRTKTIKHTSEYNLASSESRKIACNFKIDEKEDIYEYLVAIVRDGDFEGQNHTDMLPDFMIKFQKPTIINVESPRLKSVG